MAMCKHVLLALALSSVCSLLHAEALISEIHYDNAGTDIGEGVEVSASDGISVSGWRVIRYNGADGHRYGADLLLPAMPSAHCSGYSTYNIPVTDVDGLQNGSPDGLALVDEAGRVVQFLSYEGVFAATNGPAVGMTSSDIGASEPGTGKSGTSLQLTGGMKARTWETRMSTFGGCNDGLMLTGGASSTQARVTATNPVDMTGGLSTTPTLTVTFNIPVNLVYVPDDLSFMDGIRPIELYCDNSYTWTLAHNVPYRISSSDNQTFTIVPSVLNGGDRCYLWINERFISNRDGSPQYAAPWQGITFYTLSSAAGAYYGSISAVSAMSLRAGLHDRIKGHIRIPYTYPTTVANTWEVLKAADQDPLDMSKVVDVYRNRSFSNMAGGSTSGTWNREHTWPKSIGFPCTDSDVARPPSTSYDFAAGGRCDNPMDLPYRPNNTYTDLHMLHVVDSDYNTARGSKTYGYCRPSSSGGVGGLDECTELPTDNYLGVGGGSGVYPGWSNWYSQGHGADQQRDTFEVWRGKRGDVARALFYMDIRYEGGMTASGSREPDLRLTNDRSLINWTMGHMGSVAYMGLLCDLVRWHEEDPVDTQEIRRNDQVQSYQTNRNPFIDHPEWVRAIYGADCP